MKFFIDEEVHAKDHNLEGLLGWTLSKSYQSIDDQYILIGQGFEIFKEKVDFYVLYICRMTQ